MAPTAGFVAAKLHSGQQIGEIYMIAVDPTAQQRGIGTALTETATEWLRQSGMTTAMIEAGGDPGHAPARRLYEKAGYIALPAVRFFKSVVDNASSRRRLGALGEAAPLPRSWQCINPTHARTITKGGARETGPRSTCSSPNQCPSTDAVHAMKTRK